MLLRKPHDALLALADGSLFWGQAIGAQGSRVGEAVFNTALTGYQEILTDPSYCRQIVTLTYPHIGNTGTNEQDQEAETIRASGLVVRDCPPRSSNWRARQSLPDYLCEHGVVAVAGVDTRRLTRVLRERGAQDACLVAASAIDAEAAVAQARAFPGLAGMDLAKRVSVGEPYVWTEGVWRAADNCFHQPGRLAYHVVAYDYGIKRNILRLLVEHGCRVTVVPAETPASDVLALNPHGVFLSNGPGDPEPCDYAIRAVRQLLRSELPLFGICLGHQLLALACGARTVKMKFGHHGANHPVQELATGRVLISSQNHGFAVDEASLPDGLRATHRSLFDASLQGIERTDPRYGPAFGFQGHPEASPGPHELTHLFKRFSTALQAHA